MNATAKKPLHKREDLKDELEILRFIVSDDILAVVLDKIAAMGRPEAELLVQRVVGRPETGSLTLVDIELVNGMNEQHFLNCLDNLSEVFHEFDRHPKENESALPLPFRDR